MIPARFAVSRLGKGLDAAGLAPTIARDGAWRATLGGLVLYLAWQAVVATVAAVAYIDRVRGAACHIGPLCGTIAGWGDGRVALASLVVLSLSLLVFVGVGRVALACWRRRFWAAIAARVAGWATLIGGLLLILVGGLPWLVVGAWIAYWARRLRLEPPAWARSPGSDAPPPDPMVIEGERA